MIGDTPPKQLASAIGMRRDQIDSRLHLITEEFRRMQFFHQDATKDPRADFTDVRWIQLKASGLWLSYGELTALPDYLPNPETADALPRDILLPVVQRLRQAIQDSIDEHLPSKDIWQHLSEYQQGQASHGGVSGVFSAGAQEVNAVDDATASLGTERYKAVLSRNACHFAPYSWERWRNFHNEARELAAKAHAADPWTIAALRLQNESADAGAPERQAVIKNGFGDHYLQDSFAAGHLANKTLVMQWYVEWAQAIKDHAWIERLLPATITAIQDSVGKSIPGQAGIVGRDLYKTGGRGTATAPQDRAGGTNATDPQSAEERHSRAGRIAGSGVLAGGGRTLEENYQRYLKLLNNAVANLAAGEAHDFLNHMGLRVMNSAGDEFAIGGDNTMLALSDAKGAELASRASHDSAGAIDDLIRTGSATVSGDDIFRLVPNKIVVTFYGMRTEYGLEEYQDRVLHDICVERLFPDFALANTNRIVGFVASELVDDGASQDSR